MSTFNEFWFQTQGGGPDPGLIGNSLRFRNGQYLTWTPSGTLSGTKWTFSFWLKRGNDNTWTMQILNSNGQYQDIGLYNDDNGPQTAGLAFSTGTLPQILSVVTKPFRDPSAWYHVVWAWDTSQSNSALRSRYWVNNREIAISELAYNGAQPGQGASSNTWGGQSPRKIGTQNGDSRSNLIGYLADFHFTDGQVYGPTDFGEYNDDGVWVPKKVSGINYGNYGWYLDFSDPNNIGADRSGNGQNWTPTGFELSNTASTDYDLMVDSPTNNHAVRNAIYRPYGPSRNILSSFWNANLSGANGTASPHYHPQTVAIPPGTGPVYMEGYVRTISGGGGSLAAGATIWRDQTTTQNYTGVCSWTLYSGNFDWAGGTGTSSGGGQQGSGMTIGVYVDRTNNEVRFYKNGTLYGTGNPSAAAADSDWYVGINSTTGSNVRCDWDANFGQRPFVTSGMDDKGMCTALLPAAPITNPSEHFQTVLNTGANILNSATSTFPNGLWWIKDRANSSQFQLVDSVRGSTVAYQSPAAGAQTSYAAPAGNSVAWCWNAPEEFTPVSSNDQILRPNLSRRNKEAGFAMISYTPINLQTPQWITTGLDKPAEFVITKRLNATRDITCGSPYLMNGWSDAILLNSSLSASGQPSYWDSKGAQVQEGNNAIWLGNSGNTGGNSDYIMYAWHSVPGYSAMGKYLGNGNANGPFVYTGHRPGWIMIRQIDSSGSWAIYDNERSTYNPVQDSLRANEVTQEQSLSSVQWDILSNGFKVRNSNADYNTSGKSYLWIAFAEHPFGGSNVSPSPAR